MDGAASTWMQRLKRNQEDDGVSKRAAMDAGVSSLAFDSLSSVLMFQKFMFQKVGQRTFHLLAWPTFFALTHQQCSLCQKPWKGAVSQIGAYIHKNCRLGTTFPQNQFIQPGSVPDK